MKITIEMPDVAECPAADCAYNSSGGCHARAITIGDGVHTMCDTFLASDDHTRDTARIAGVGACKVPSCSHNEDFECHASHVALGLHERHADCLTFSAR